MADEIKLSIEECKALYFDDSALLEPARKLYRLNGYAGGRYYYSLNDSGDPTFFIGVTNMIKKTLPTSEYLINWIAELGQDEAKIYTQQRADYGTFMHMLFTKLLIEKKLDMDLIDDELRGFLHRQSQPIVLFEDWIDELKKDVLAFAQFIKDHKVKPLAIEVVLASIDGGFAGAVDIICNMTIEEKGFWGEVYKSGERKGEPKETKKEIEVIAIVDNKSGRKGFFEAHEIQLEAYKVLVQENFPDIKVDKLYNFAPSEWRTVPSYKLKDQTDSPNREKFDYLVALGNIEMKKREKSVVRISGTLDLEKELTEVYQDITISSLVKDLNAENRKKERDREAFFDHRAYPAPLGPREQIEITMPLLFAKETNYKKGDQCIFKDWVWEFSPNEKQPQESIGWSPSKANGWEKKISLDE